MTTTTQLALPTPTTPTSPSSTRPSTTTNPTLTDTCHLFEEAAGPGAR